MAALHSFQKHISKNGYQLILKFSLLIFNYVYCFCSHYATTGAGTATILALLTFLSLDLDVALLVGALEHLVEYLVLARGVNQLGLELAVACAVREEVRLGPRASQTIELLVHVVDIDLVDELGHLGPLLHEVVAPLPPFLHSFRRVDPVAQRPQIVSVGLLQINEDYLEIGFDVVQK